MADVEMLSKIKATQCDFCKLAKPNRSTDCRVRKVIITGKGRSVLTPGQEILFFDDDQRQYFEPKD